MTSRRKSLALTLALALALASLGGLGTLHAETDGDAAKAALQPGETTVSPGCVDCHNGDMAATIGTLLDGLGHMPVDDMVETVPDDCMECHGEAGGAWMMSEMSHVLHFEDPTSNAFVIDHGGNCLSCHVMDVETGEVQVKSGPRNW